MKISLQVPDAQLELIDELVAENLYHDRNDAISQAIRDLLKFHKKL